MKQLSTLCSWLGTSLATLVLLLATGLPARAQQPEAIQQATQLALQTRSQWAGADIPATSFRISSAYSEPSGLLYAYPQQLQAGIPVYNQIATLVFKGGQLAHHAGSFIAAKTFASQPATPTVTAATAVTTALASTKAKTTEQPTATSAANGIEQQQMFAAAGVARRPIEVHLVWATDKGMPRLAWNVNVDLLAKPDWLNIRVDAATGQVLGQDNWTVEEKAVRPAALSGAAHGAVANPATQPLARSKGLLASPKSTQAVAQASYTVVTFPGERPDVTTPTTDTNPWLRAGAGNNAATYGWHFDGTTNYTITRGNNVAAYDDAANTNAPGNYAPSQTTPTLSFGYVADFTAAPNTATNRNAAVTNLFYWNNLMHDVFYQYGFTEAAGNFQKDNIGRGGVGNDHVLAEAQDGGGTNNANFATPADGTSGRMQMYLFNLTTPGRDGDFDSGVMSHEYGHGISHRLTGGPANASCLGNVERGDEGWSDYFGLMMTTNWATAQLTDGAKARPVGTYVLGQSPTAGGIRRYPYSTSLSINPLTYADLTASPEVHDIGEIWCATLWDLTWALIQQQGTIEPNLYNSVSTGGNAIALQLVLQGLKLQPCQPGFLDSRDAILAADNMLYGGQYDCLIKNVFARRGMGTSAVEGSATSTSDQVAAFDGSLLLRKYTTPTIGNQFTITLEATNGCSASGQSFNLTDQLPADLQYLSSTGGTLGSNNTVTFSNLTFAAGQTRTFQIVVQTAPGKGCAATIPINDDRDANTTGGLTPAVRTGTNAWAPSTVQAYSGTTSWRAPDAAATSDVTLTSAAFTPAAFSVLSFYHYYNLEFGWDGGLVSLSTDGGTTWIDAAPYFVQNGYKSRFYTTSTPSPGLVSPGKPCFSGNLSAATGAAAYIQTILDLSSFSGQSVQVRFQLQTDVSNDPGTFTGWFLDDIKVVSGCGGYQRVQLVASSNAAVQGSYLTPTFLTPLPVPVISSFSPTSGQVGSTIAITGTDLTGTTLITFGGTANNTVSTGFTVNAAGTSITGIVVPSGAATGPLSVTTPGGVASTSGLTPANFTVIAPTTTVLASSLNPSTVGQQVTLTASVSGSGALPTGSIEFRDGTTLLGTVALGATGQAALQTSSLLAGSHALSATYLGSTTYAGSTGSLVQVVNAVVVTATTWTGNVSQDWFTAGNWTAGVPTSTIDAVIPTGRPLYPVLASGNPVTRALSNAGTITQAGGTIAVGTTFTNTGTLTHSGGDITVGSALTNSGTFTFTGGVLTVNGDLTNTGTFTPTNSAGTGGSTVVLGGGSTAANILGSQAIRFWNLTVQANGALLGTSAGASVRRVLTLNGNVATQGNSFTIESASTGDGLVVNSGGVVTGTATVQRFINPSLNSGPGYRHYSAPVSNSTVSDLSTTASGGSFSPVVNPAYNTAAAPTAVSPFPTVYGYNDSRLSLPNNLAPFDKGYVSPTTLSDPLAVGKGYTVNIAASQLVDFQGTLTTGDLSLALTSTRPTYPTDGGWQLLGNPYPAPLDYRLVAATDRTGLEASIYVYSSTSQYAGQYRSYVNGVGNSILPMGQAFFTRVAAGQASATLNFRNSQRLSVPTTTATFQRPAETRPLVELTLQGAGSPLLDEATVYFENGATSDFDPSFDARKLPNVTGLNLSTGLASGQQLSIDGQPELGTSQRVLPLAVGVPAPGSYTLAASQLLNLSAVPVYLRDLQLGTLTDLRQQPSYPFTVANATSLLTSRFELVFSPQQALATVPAALAQQVALYPNPARSQVTLELPLGLSRQPVTATLLDALGRVVRTQVLPAGSTSHTLPLAELASGVYALRLTTDLGQVVKKLVID